LVIPSGKDVKQDAIAVRLDHRDGYSVIVVFPYTIGPAGNVALEAPYAAKGEQKIFRDERDEIRSSRALSRAPRMEP